MDVVKKISENKTDFKQRGTILGTNPSYLEAGIHVNMPRLVYYQFKLVNEFIKLLKLDLLWPFLNLVFRFYRLQRGLNFQTTRRQTLQGASRILQIPRHPVQNQSSET